MKLSNIVLTIISICVTVLLVEVGIFSWYKLKGVHNADRNQTIDTRPLRLRPEIHNILSSKGKKQDNTVLFLGDSFTFGEGIDYIDTFPIQIQKLAVESNRNIRAINGGCGGNNMIDNYVTLKQMTEKLSVDLVVLTVNSNDYFFDPWNLHPYDVCSNMEQKKESLKYWLQKNSNLYHFIHHRLSKHSLPSPDKFGNHTPFQICSSNYFDKIISYLAKKEIKYIIAYHRGSLRKQKFCRNFEERYPAFISNFKALYGVTPLLLTDSVLSSDCNLSESFYTKDNYHFNKKGYQRFATKLLPYILTKLQLD